MSAPVCSLTLYARVPFYVRAVLGGAILAARLGIRPDLDRLGKWAASRVKVSTRPQ